MVKPIRLMGQFPPLSAGRVLRQVIADGLFGQWRLLLMIAIVPFVLALMIDIGSAIILDLRGARNLVASPEAIAIDLLALILLEVLVGAYYTTNVARLLGIGSRKGKVAVDEDWRDAFGGVALRLAVFYFIGGVLMGGGFVAYLLFRDNLPNPQLAPLMIVVPAVIQLYLYARFSFVISAAAVGAPYTFGDSMRATGGITVLVLGLNLAFSLPLVVGQLALQTSASSAPTFGLVYFGTMLLTQVLFLLRVAVFTIINLVCFVNRTGWAPGARRV